MIDHTHCLHENTKAARAKCRGMMRDQHPHWRDDHESLSVDQRLQLSCDICYPEVDEPWRPDTPESAVEAPAETKERLTQETALAGAWIALRHAGEEHRGYIVANLGGMLYYNVGRGIERLFWDEDEFEVFLDSESPRG